MRKFEVFLVIAIIAASFIVRLYKINRPVADWHSWRQTDTAAVARNFAKNKINLLFPQSDSFLINNEKGLPNPNRYFINEFPFYNAIVALLYKQFGINTALARLVSVFFASLGNLFLYLIVRKLFDLKTAIVASLFYALNPYNIFYGSTIMPDPTFVSLSIISLYLALIWTETKKWFWTISLTITFSLAMLVKPYAIFMSLPIFYWVIINWRSKIISNWQTYFVFIVSYLPLLLWRYHIHNHPEGAFASTWLLNGDNIRFTGSFFRWIIFDRLNRLIFATGAFVLFVFGILKSYQSKNGSLIFVWLISVALYITIFAKGNVTHDYYQMPIVAPGSILVALGFFGIINYSKDIKLKLLNIVVALSLFILSFAFGWFEVRGYFNINNPAIVEAGIKADQILPKDALVVADYSGDPAFLYQTNRYGYPVVERPIAEYPKIGVNYLISVKPNDEGIKNLTNKCKVLDKEQNFVIIQLDTCQAI